MSSRRKERPLQWQLLSVQSISAPCAQAHLHVPVRPPSLVQESQRRQQLAHGVVHLLRRHGAWPTQRIVKQVRARLHWQRK